MAADPVGLIGRVAGVRPGGDSARSAAGASTEAGFAQLLERARRGELESGAGVTVGAGAGVELTGEQLSRLAVAADRAEAEGIHTALAYIDGMALVLDVHTREVRGVAAGGVMSGIDGVVWAPDGAGGAPPAPGPGGVSNASLLEALARRDGHRTSGG